LARVLAQAADRVGADASRTALAVRTIAPDNRAHAGPSPEHLTALASVVIPGAPRDNVTGAGPLAVHLRAVLAAPVLVGRDARLAWHYWSRGRAEHRAGNLAAASRLASLAEHHAALARTVEPTTLEVARALADALAPRALSPTVRVPRARGPRDRVTPGPESRATRDASRRERDRVVTAPVWERSVDSRHVRTDRERADAVAALKRPE